MKFRRQKRSQDGVNLTPLIDVVFLLLIFFMVSTTFTKETHLVVDLPEADGESSETQPETIDIVIEEDGTYRVNGRVLVNRKIETLMAALKGLAGDETETALSITADANATHQAVVTAMDAAGRTGFIHLSITTRHPESE